MASVPFHSYAQATNALLVVSVCASLLANANALSIHRDGINPTEALLEINEHGASHVTPMSHVHDQVQLLRKEPQKQSMSSGETVTKVALPGHHEETSFLQTSISFGAEGEASSTDTSKAAISSGPHDQQTLAAKDEKARASIMRKETSDGGASRKLAAWPSASSRMSALRNGVVDIFGYAVDEAKNMERQQVTMLLIISCLGVSIVVALTRPGPVKAKIPRVPITATQGDWSPLNEQFGPAEKTMGAAVIKKQYVDPEECSHPEECCHEYTARNQTFSICNHCGSRWMLQKNTNTWQPIARKCADY